MFCTKCGFEIKDGYKFCPKCGTPAFVEKEESKSEIEAQVEDAKMNVEEEEAVVNTNDKTKIILEPKTASSSKGIKADYERLRGLIPNPSILEELELDKYKKYAEDGNKVAMLIQAFRYEMGIGVDKNLEKANQLYAKVTDYDIIGDMVSLYFFSVELSDNLCVTKKTV